MNYKELEGLLSGFDNINQIEDNILSNIKNSTNTLGIEDNFEKIKSIIQNYDRKDLLKTIASLQLLPNNMKHQITIEAILNIILSDKPNIDLRNCISNGGVKKLFCMFDENYKYITAQQDPSENPFTESIAFYGGTYTVFPGISNYPTFIVRYLLQSCTRYDNLNNDYKQKIISLARFILSISNNVSTSANINRNHNEIEDTQEINIPNKEKLKINKNAITFSSFEFINLLERNNLEQKDIKSFIIEFGDIEIENYSLDNNELLRKPIAKVGDEYIVINISMLLSALIHNIVILSKKYNCTNSLALNYSKNTWINTLESVKRLNMNILEDSICETEFYKECLFSFDTDKYLYVQFTSDNFESYEEETIFGYLDDEEFFERLVRNGKIKEVNLKNKEIDLSKVINLKIVCGIGRQAFYGIEKDAYNLSITLNTAELELLSFDEIGNDMFLWDYIKYKYNMKSMFMGLNSELDTIEMFKQNEKSFYFSDERIDTLAIFPGECSSLVRRIVSNLDRHGVPFIKENSYIEVVKKDSPDMSIYTPINQLSFPPMAYVETLKCGIWVTTDGKFLNEEDFDISIKLLDMMAYWLEIGSEIINKFFEKKYGYSIIIINLNITSKSFIEDNDHTTKNTIDKYIRVNMNETINLEISTDIMEIFAGNCNNGEFIFMKRIFELINLILGDNDNREIYIDEIKELFKNPIQKKIITLNGSNNIEINPHNLGSVRYINEIESNIILDDIGNYLINELNIPIGKIEDSRRTEVLNKIVDFLYNIFVKEIKALSNEGLCEFLIKENEKIQYEYASFNLKIPTTIACYSKSNCINDIKSKKLKLNGTSVSSRFLIEYISSQKPNGKNNINIDIYRRLITISSLIINYAFYSDIIKYNLGDIKLEILPSERLGIKQESYLKSYNNYMEDYTIGEIYRSNNYLKSILNDKSGEHIDNHHILKDINLGFEDEYGFKYEYLIKIVNYLIGYMLDNKYDFLTINKVLIIKKIEEELKIEEKVIDEIIHYLSLIERSNFLKPKSPYRGEDVYPWRYNRKLSYLRKPIICDSENNLYMGLRNLNQSISYLIGLITSGKLRCDKKQMKIVVSKFANDKGKIFNQNIANKLRKIQDLEIYENVKKINGNKISNNKGDLGDIDILVINRKKNIILVVECKNIGIGRNPLEVASEIEEIFTGRNKKLSFIEKNNNRVSWVKDNISDLIKYYNLDNKKNWKVKTIFVLNEELMSPHIIKSKTKFIPISSLEEKIKKVIK